MDAAFYAFVAGFLGGRLYYVIFKWGHYSANPLKIFAIWEGGMAIHGGIIGGMIGLWFYARSSGISVRMLWDMAAPALTLGHALGRFGNFMNGDAHGYPLRSPQLPGWLQPLSGMDGRGVSACKRRRTGVWPSAAASGHVCTSWL